uniref:Fucosyltransferase n=1 Tax=Dracunculus medinensis TaxID=318479 RepID=A0A0N4UDT0_DRAME
LVRAVRRRRINRCEISKFLKKIYFTIFFRYFFYIAFENSICKDYITEKLWNQGYQHDIVPLVLRRKIVQNFVPPHSFIAVDDFKSAKHLADYLKYLMKNRTAYLEYFNWRRDYAVIFLDGVKHDSLEKPWGLCQLCRYILFKHSLI